MVISYFDSDAARNLTVTVMFSSAADEAMIARLVS